MAKLRKAALAKGFIFLVAVPLAACGQGAQPGGNSAAGANAVELHGVNHCELPKLAMADGSQRFESALLKETQANFRAALQSACSKGVLEDATFMDPHSSDQQHLYLVNAPEANVASIYMSEVDDSRMMLEYPFLTTDGRSQVPSAAELEEAIYCAAVGATPEKQESTGRCLVD